MLRCGFFWRGPIAAPAPWCATRRMSTFPNAKSVKNNFYTFRKCQIHIKPNSTLPNAKSIKNQLLRFPEMMPNPHKTKFYTPQCQIHKKTTSTLRRCQIHTKPTSTLTQILESPTACFCFVRGCRSLQIVNLYLGGGFR